MSPIRPAALALGSAAVLGFAALVVLGNTDVTRPASPPSKSPEVEYVGCYYNPRNKDVARRLAAGEDPATIPGAICTTSGPPSPSAPGSSAPGISDGTSAPTPR